MRSATGHDNDHEHDEHDGSSHYYDFLSSPVYYFDHIRRADDHSAGDYEHVKHIAAYYDDKLTTVAYYNDRAADAGSASSDGDSTSDNGQ